MAERFNLTAQLQLQAPSNTAQVVGQIRKQLQGASVDVKIKANPRQVAEVNKELQNVNKAAGSSAKSVGLLNQNLAAAARRFSVITVATGAFLGLARAIKNSTGEAIAFERELLKISQVTGKSTQQLGGLVEEVTRLSRSLGASSGELLSVSKTLAQAGFSAQKTKQALESLAQTTLAATFTSIEDTTEAAIAVLRQFSNEARRSGGEIQFLQSTLDAINSVSKSFAVEAGDLTTVIRRVGGVFSSAGGSVNELIALFTSVRSTTRESAETIATGLRTIFTRIQRTDTVDQLAELGIQLRDSQGQFVGAYEAVRRLSAGLSALDPRDFRFSEIVESLGGFRQVGKVIPLIQQFVVAQDALNVAQNASGSVAKDAEIAQQGLGNQIAKVRQDFEALMRQFADSSTFRAVAGGALELAKAFIKIASSLEGMLPLIATLISMKIGQAIGPGIASIFGGGARRKNQGGKIHAFARGGYVPGTGNRDTVPAMLQPGEFVIKKSSAESLGSSTLEAMNNNRYADGGITVSPKNPEKYGIFTLKPPGGTIAGGSGQEVKSPTGQAAIKAAIKSQLNKKITKKDVKGKEQDSSLVTQHGHPSTSSGFAKFMNSKEGLGFDGAKEYSKLPAEERKSFRAKFIKTQVGSRIKQETARRKGLKESIEEGRKKGEKDGIGPIKMKGPFPSLPIGGPGSADEVDSALSTQFQTTARSMLGSAVEEIANTQLIQDLQIPSFNVDESKLFDFDRFYNGAQEATEGFLLEGVIGGLTNAKIEGGSGKFDFPSFTGRAKERLKKLFAGGESGDAAIDALLKADAKRQKASAIGGESSLVNKISTDPDADFRLLASGGGISGSDTVPALLTPGEFVINKSSAQSIGYANLSKMNQTGVKRFAAGGPVGTVQRFAEGGEAFNQSTSGGAAELRQAAAVLKKSLEFMTKNFEDGGDRVAAGMAEFNQAITEGASKIDVVSRAKGVAMSGSQGESVSMAGVSTVDQEVVASVNADYNTLSKTIKHMTTTMVASGASAEEVEAAEKQLSSNQKIHSKTIKSLIDEGKKGKISSSSLAAARDTLTKTLQTNDKMARKELKRQAAPKGAVAKHFPTVAAGVQGTKKTLGKIGQAAEGMKERAQSAQSIAFMGAAAATSAIQMSSMGDTTKQAATETVAFATALTSAGATAIEMLSGLANMGQVAAAANLAAAESEIAETTANVASTTTEGVEAVADTVEAGASSAAAAPLLILVAIVAAVVLALKYFSAKATAEADALATARKDLLSKIGSGEGGTAKQVQANVEQEQAKRKEAEDWDWMSIGREVYAQTPGGVLTGTKDVDAAVSVDDQGKASVSLWDTMKKNATFADTMSFGMANATKSLYVWATTTDEAAQAIADEVVARKSLHDSMNASIVSFVRLAESGHKFDTAMADLNQLEMPDTEEAKQDKLQQQMEITSELDTSKINAEYMQLAEIAGLAGQSISSLSEQGLEDQFGKGSKELIQFQLSTKAADQALANMAKKSKAARDAFNQAAELELNIGGEETFADIIAKGGQLATAFNLVKESIQDQADAAIAKAQADREAAKDMIKAGEGMTGFFGGPTKEGEEKVKTGQEALKAANEAEAKAKERAKKQTEDLEKSGEAQRNAVIALNIANREAAAAADALAAQLQATTNFMKQLSSIEFDQGQYSKNLSNQASIVDGGRMDHSVDIKGLDQEPAMIQDLDQFSTDMMTAIGDLPAGMQKEAKRQLATVVKTSKLFTEGKDNVLKAFPVGTTDLGKNFDPLAIISAAGLDPDTMDADILKDMVKQIKEKAQDGVSNAEFEEIFGAQKEAGNAAQAANQQINAVRNADLSNYKQYVAEIAKIRDRDVQAAVANVDAENRVAEMKAKARGGDLSIQEKEAGRTTSAQASLVGIRDPSGKRVQAGNIDQVLATRMKAEQDLDQVSKTIKSKDPSLDKTERAKLIAQEERLADVVKRTTDELGRLSDQGGRAADIMGEIEKEQGKRDVAKGMLQDFVFGGQEDRGAMNMGLAGVQAAAATGTVQNQSEEQRKATEGMLDRLGDIEIGGRSAKDIKQQIIFDDAIKMGIDPKIARSIATATSKEEKLIKSLDDLGDTIIAATKAQGTRFTPDFQPPGGMAGTITGTNPTSLQNAQSQVANMSDAEVLNELRSKKLQSFDAEEKAIKSGPDRGKGEKLKKLRSDRASFIKEQKGERADFLQNKGKFEKGDARDSMMATGRDQLAEMLDTGSSAKSRAFQTEGEIGAIRKPRRGARQATSFQAGGAVGQVGATPLSESQMKSAREYGGSAETMRQVRTQEQGVDPDAMQQISTIAQHPERYNPTEAEKATQAGSMKRFISGQQGVKNRNQISVQGEASIIGAGESGGMSIDPTKIGEVLTNFNTNFATTLEAVVTPFKEMATNLSGLNESFQNLTMTHKFQGDMSMAFNITNQAELVDVISKGITGTISDLITARLEGKAQTDSMSTTGSTAPPTSSVSGRARRGR